MMSRNQRSIIILAGLVFLPILTVLIEFQTNLFENWVGAYLEAGNDQRERLPKFVDREARNVQAQQQVETLLTLKEAQQEEEDPAVKKIGHTELVRLKDEQKVIMTRERFLETHKEIARTSYALPQMSHISQMPWYDEWARIIMVRAGWLRPGQLFFVDNRNYMLSKTPLSADQFDILYAYAVTDSSAFDSNARNMRIYTSQRFFAMLRGLPSTIRDEIISPHRFLDIESTARRIGIEDKQSDGSSRIVIETVHQNQIEVISIPVTDMLLQEIYIGLGEVFSQSDASSPDPPE